MKKITQLFTRGLNYLNRKVYTAKILSLNFDHSNKILRIFK